MLSPITAARRHRLLMASSFLVSGLLLGVSTAYAQQAASQDAGFAGFDPQGPGFALILIELLKVIVIEYFGASRLVLQFPSKRRA